MGLKALATGTASITGGSISGTNARSSVAQSAIPFIHISSGSIGNNGALTGVTALPLTYGGGAYCYFPANAIAAGVGAGWYWTVFSSTTAGTIYNSTYTSGAPVAGVTTAFATTGPGAFTGVVTEIAGPTITTPIMGANSVLKIEADYHLTNSANVKTPRIRLGGGAGTVYWSNTFSTQTQVAVMVDIKNRGNTARQVGRVLQFCAAAPLAATITETTVTAFDLATPTTVVFSLQKDTATENAILSAFMFDHLYAA